MRSERSPGPPPDPCAPGPFHHPVFGAQDRIVLARSALHRICPILMLGFFQRDITTMPVGIWVIRTAEIRSVYMLAPLPPMRAWYRCEYLHFELQHPHLQLPVIPPPFAADVWTLPPDSVSGTRCTPVHTRFKFESGKYAFYR